MQVDTRGAESFYLLMQDGKATIYAKSLRFAVKSFNDSPVELNEDFMLEEALGQASIDLIEYLDKEDKNYRDLTNTSDLLKAR